jgi:hypothetical protein
VQKLCDVVCEWMGLATATAGTEAAVAAAPAPAPVGSGCRSSYVARL